MSDQLSINIEYRGLSYIPTFPQRLPLVEKVDPTSSDALISHFQPSPLLSALHRQQKPEVFRWHDSCPNIFSLDLTISRRVGTLLGMDPTLIAITLTLVSALESSQGQNTAHETVRNPASVHFGQAAVGQYGMMPNTMALLKTTDPTLAAYRYAARGLRRTRGCPITVAVVLWEQGLNTSLSPRAWRRANGPQRLKKALAIWDANGYDRTLKGCYIYDANI